MYLKSGLKNIDHWVNTFSGSTASIDPIGFYIMNILCVLKKLQTNLILNVFTSEGFLPVT